MTFAEYEAKLLAQGGGCAICGCAPGKKRHGVDHDHRTGAVRGLLCVPCNTWLGFLEKFLHVPGWEAKALRYLQDHAAIPQSE